MASIVVLSKRTSIAISRHLCPSDALKDFVAEDLEAAHYVSVSTSLIEAMLANKGYID